MKLLVETVAETELSDYDVYSVADTFEYLKGDVVLKDPNTSLELELKKVFE
jgi:hypothetical protein